MGETAVSQARPLPGHVRVAIIGAGFAGIGAGIRLLQSGRTDFIILERASSVGGTWRDNSYPGCMCDIPSHIYSYSFAPNPGWSHSFSRQPEILAYLSQVAGRYQLPGHIRLETEVREARWDGAAMRWRVRTTRGELTADVLIAAGGPLSNPAIPDLPGLDTFPGEVFHSARWDHGADLAGRRVAVVGTGASAIQIVSVDPAGGAAADAVPAHPGLGDAAAGPADHQAGEMALPARATGPAGGPAGPGPQPGIAGGRLRAAARAAAGRAADRRWRHLARSVRDPELRARLTPRYVLGCKRVLLSSDYYPALVQPNAEVIASGLAKVDGHTLTAQDGTAREADAIIFATGFHVTDMPLAEHLYGAGGVSLAGAWAGDMRALRGTTVAGFPNLCLLIGPNTGLGHNSLIHIIEAQLELRAGLPRCAGPDRGGGAGRAARGRAALER